MEKAQKMNTQLVFDEIYGKVCNTAIEFLGKDKIPDACKRACATGGTNPVWQDFIGCSVSLADMHKGKEIPGLDATLRTIKLACDHGPACSGKWLGVDGSYKAELIRDMCGAVCCPLGGDVKNCLESYGKDNCAKFDAEVQKVKATLKK